jgi:hypothetical protein
MYLIGFQIFEKEIWVFGKSSLPHRTCRNVVDFGARRVDSGAGGLRRRIETAVANRSKWPLRRLAHFSILGEFDFPHHK